MLEALGSLAAALWAALSPGTVLLGAIVFLLFAHFLKRWQPKNYPPGPPRLPFIGNFFQLDFDKAHLSLQQLGASDGARVCPDPDLRNRGHSRYRGREDGGSEAEPGTRLHLALNLFSPVTGMITPLVVSRGEILLTVHYLVDLEDAFSKPFN